MPLFHKNPDSACKITGWRDGWEEYENPCVHGTGNQYIRRFFRNEKLNCTMWTQENIPCNPFKDISMCACIDYREPKNGKMYLLKDSDVTYEDGCLVVNSPESVPEDKELLNMFTGEKITMGDILMDMYGTVCMLAIVKDEEHAFNIAELIAKRVKGF